MFQVKNYFWKKFLYGTSVWGWWVRLTYSHRKRNNPSKARKIKIKI